MEDSHWLWHRVTSLILCKHSLLVEPSQEVQLGKHRIVHQLWSSYQFCMSPNDPYADRSTTTCLGYMRHTSSRFHYGKSTVTTELRSRKVTDWTNGSTQESQLVISALTEVRNDCKKDNNEMTHFASCIEKYEYIAQTKRKAYLRNPFYSLKFSVFQFYRWKRLVEFRVWYLIQPCPYTSGLVLMKPVMGPQHWPLGTYTGFVKGSRMWGKLTTVFYGQVQSTIRLANSQQLTSKQLLFILWRVVTSELVKMSTSTVYRPTMR